MINYVSGHKPDNYKGKIFIIMYSGAHSTIYDFETLLAVAQNMSKTAQYYLF